MFTTDSSAHSESTTFEAYPKDVLTESAPKNLNDIADIGLHAGKKVDDFTKCLLLEKPWHPTDDYCYPYSVHSKGEGKTVRRYLSKSHIDKYHWLVYSDVSKGLFCKYCALFAQEKVGHNKGVKVNRLVMEALTTFKDLTANDGYLETHERSNYHRACVASGKDFLRTYKAPEKEILNQISSQRLLLVEENRARLRPIIETVIFMGRQNISFRGHRDDGELCLDSESRSVTNEGNFRALLNFRIQAGDTKLREHLENASSRATYISKTTQNVIIKYCAEEISNVIIERIKNAKYWSIIFDETTDRAHAEQMTLIVRYVYNSTVREDFLFFVDAFKSLQNPHVDNQGPDVVRKEVRLTANALARIVIDYTKDLGLDLNYCVGVGTDGCAFMTSEKCGAVSELLRVATNAKHVSCYNHALNNSISKSSKIQSVRNATAVMKEVIAFFSQSAKKNAVLKAHVGSQLIRLCETRWVERHDAVILFF
ncbi:uncharacterized protein LOC134527639 [Bacillus rossius redtenbacheri]|uniref:uncharacterized protein LOC134527639 n=1 Tax=Bacillus rossius redtenbacheri TaxID=93214 RepID=UPI002FDC849C